MANALATQEVQNEVVDKLKQTSEVLRTAISSITGKERKESFKRLVSEEGKDM
jgi:hypothetical protein